MLILGPIYPILGKLRIFVKKWVLKPWCAYLTLTSFKKKTGTSNELILDGQTDRQS